jgi:AmmeMemoRadiSam system protein B
MKRVILLFLVIFIFVGCTKEKTNKMRVRGFVDTVGFAHKSYQVDSVLKRIDREFGSIMNQKREAAGIDSSTEWKAVICPHDDHAYVSYLYPLLLRNVKAKTLIIFGVGHKAKKLGLADSLVFGTYKEWKGAYGNIEISPLRDEIVRELDKRTYVINDSMEEIEHSIEAFLPFLQKFNGDIKIVPIIVPYMSYSRMQEIGKELAKVIFDVTREHNMVWGKDYAIIMSTDAVHYGDKDWGGNNFAFYGADTAGYKKAVEHEQEIIKTLTGNISLEKIKRFTEYTVKSSDYREYKWTWCGRYSVPMGLLTIYYLEKMSKADLQGQLIDYETSISHKTLYVKDLGMGTTAPANIHHWVGYAAIGYR